MNVQTRHPYEGLLHKYTNAMKGWQYRWFILSPETGELHYFLSESEKNQRPRCSIYLAGAVIAPSDEDSNTFTVNSATGRYLIVKLNLLIISFIVDINVWFNLTNEFPISFQVTWSNCELQMREHARNGWISYGQLQRCILGRSPAAILHCHHENILGIRAGILSLSWKCWTPLPIARSN